MDPSIIKKYSCKFKTELDVDLQTIINDCLKSQKFKKIK